MLTGAPSAVVMMANRYDFFLCLLNLEPLCNIRAASEGGMGAGANAGEVMEGGSHQVLLHPWLIPTPLLPVS